LFAPLYDLAVTETRLFRYWTPKSVKRCDIYRCASNKSNGWGK